MRLKTFLTFAAILLFSSSFTLFAQYEDFYLDLRFTTPISQTPSPAYTGNTVTFTVSFKPVTPPEYNQIFKCENLKVTGRVDNHFIFEKTFASIPANTVNTISFTWTATKGTHKVYFELDPNEVQGDANYNDNKIEKELKVTTLFTVPTLKKGLPLHNNVGILQLPNLIKCSASYTCYTGQKKVGLHFCVKNDGTGPAGASKMLIRVYDGNNVIFSVKNDVPPLNAGQITLQEIYNIQCFHHAKITVDIDSDKEVVESNEKDNQWSEIINCPYL
jgi:hypothetical protein